MELAVHSAGPCVRKSQETLWNEASRDCWAPRPMRIEVIGKETLVHVFNLKRYNSRVALAPMGAMLGRPWAVFLKAGSEKSSQWWGGRGLRLTSDLLYQRKGMFVLKVSWVILWEPLL